MGEAFRTKDGSEEPLEEGRNTFYCCNREDAAERM